ncbi:hypothetical protein RGQ01_06530 [Akkermansia sp. EB-AMDK43]|uniref:hypothetical protein n=1 Tax=unclassified Akkermansia TaxID=2608915 RepID=UPI0028692258|nr:hypothetical protein [Akkermansia sp. EB-AMDK43]WMX39392.1 hypothetical protein RGQ01_06530 [Akkermansia sp. EB-AMDK43]
MTEPSPTPGIRAALNGAGELELTMVNAPAGAVIRMDVNATSPACSARRAATWLRCRPRPARASASACSRGSAV